MIFDRARKRPTGIPSASLGRPYRLEAGPSLAYQHAFDAAGAEVGQTVDALGCLVDTNSCSFARTRQDLLPSAGSLYFLPVEGAAKEVASVPGVAETRDVAVRKTAFGVARVAEEATYHRSNSYTMAYAAYVADRPFDSYQAPEIPAASAWKGATDAYHGPGIVSGETAAAAALDSVAVDPGIQVAAAGERFASG